MIFDSVTVLYPVHKDFILLLGSPMIHLEIDFKDFFFHWKLVRIPRNQSFAPLYKVASNLYFELNQTLTCY